MNITNEIFVVKRDYIGALFAGEEIQIKSSSDCILVKVINRGWPTQERIKSQSKKPKFVVTQSGHWHHYAIEVRFAPVPVDATEYMSNAFSILEWHQQLYDQFIAELKQAGVI
jgi:hypothetical protein